MAKYGTFVYITLCSSMQTVFVQYEFQSICLSSALSDTELTLIQRPGVESVLCTE